MCQQTLWGRMLRAMNYKPGWWALYAVYVAIPIVAYIVCLVRRANEDSVFDRAMRFAGDNPWVYALLIVVTFLVVGLVAYACFGSKSDSDADMKKTDAVVEDDPHQSDGEAEAEEELKEEAERPSKADLEGPEVDNDDAEVITTTEEVADTTPLVDTEGAGDGQRKRKPRRE